MAISSSKKDSSVVVSAASVRPQCDSILRCLDTGRRPLLIERKGTSTAALMDIRDYVKLASPEPEILRLIGEEAAQKGTNRLTSRQIDQVIKATRTRKKRR